jgi:hypothetical protein
VTGVQTCALPISCDQVTTYDIMDAHHIVIGEKAIEKVQQILG